MTEENRRRVEAAAVYAAQLCMQAGEDQAFYDGFWQRLLKHSAVLAEFIFYQEHQEFACRVKVADRTVADVLVWQIDHFKAAMDQDRDSFRQHQETMVLYAFDTMLKMAEDPLPYAARMAQETGTDYPGKY